VDLDSRGVGRSPLVVDRNDSSWTGTETRRRAAETLQGHGGVTTPGCRLRWCRCRSRCTARRAPETAAEVAGWGRGRGRRGQKALDETRRGGGAVERMGRQRGLLAPCLCPVVLGSTGAVGEASQRRSGRQGCGVWSSEVGSARPVEKPGIGSDTPVVMGSQTTGEICPRPNSTWWAYPRNTRGS
jgi:hypothetical protein